MQPDVLDLDGAAEYLHLPREVLLRRAQRRLLPAAKIAGEWRFSRRQLLRWLEDLAIPEAVVDVALAGLVEERAAAGGEMIPLSEVRERLGA